MSPPPVWLMRQAGRYLPEYREMRSRVQGFLDLVFRPELAVEITLQPLRRFPLDAAILFSDILVVPHALGQKVWFVEGEGPRMEPLRRTGDLERLSLERLEDALGPVYETVAGTAAALPRETALIGFAGAPWTVATYMVEGRGGTDHATARRWAYAEPAAFGRLVNLLVEATVVHLDRQVREGAEVVQLFDTWAGTLSESQFRQWCIRPNREIADRLKARHPGVPVIGFPRGAGVRYADFAKETGVDGVSLDSAVTLDWAAGTLQGHVALQGNLDNQLLAVGGAAMEEEARRILRTLSRGPFVFNLGHGVLPDTPPDNVARLVALVRGAEPGLA